MNDTITGLRAARALVERGWTRGEVARTASGAPVDPNDVRAVRWCAAGACWRVECLDARDQLDTQVQLEGYSSPFIPEIRPMAFWQDTHTKRDVLALFDRCIARLEAEAASE